MNSQDLKIATLDHILFKGKFLVATTESLNGSDVLGINKKNLAYEFEIKISKEDLDKELKAIRYLTGNDMNMRRARAANKLQKHATYLKHRFGYSWDTYFVPNTFSFVLPPELIDFATRGIRGTPYGLYRYNKEKKILEVVIKPGKIHTKPVSEENLAKIHRKISTENYFLRVAKNTT